VLALLRCLEWSNEGCNHDGRTHGVGKILSKAVIGSRLAFSRQDQDVLLPRALRWSSQRKARQISQRYYYYPCNRSSNLKHRIQVDKSSPTSVNDFLTLSNAGEVRHPTQANPNPRNAVQSPKTLLTGSRANQSAPLDRGVCHESLAEGQATQMSDDINEFAETRGVRVQLDNCGAKEPDFHSRMASNRCSCVVRPRLSSCSGVTSDVPPERSSALDEARSGKQFRR
jgi:hypothetical protein